MHLLSGGRATRVQWRAEAEIAAAVLCPLHGLRFHIVVTRDLYRAFRFYITDYKDGWPRQSAQYQKAMRASFDWSLWPPQKEKDKEFGQDSVLILRDGTELPSGGSAVGYTPGLEKRSLCGREAERSES